MKSDNTIVNQHGTRQGAENLLKHPEEAATSSCSFQHTGINAFPTVDRIRLCLQ